MKNHIRDWMARATSLTRNGDLQAATAALQSALARHSPAGAPLPGAVPNGAQALESLEALLRQAVPASRPVPKQPLPFVEVVDAGVPPSSKPTERQDLGTFKTGVYTAAAGSRDYKLYAPPHDGQQRLPLVVMLHGCTQDPDDFAAGTQMNTAAQERGFYVLYPAQSQQANPQRCWNWFKHNHQQRGRGEPALIAGMVQKVIDSERIDAARVYVAGLSAGGAMAAILGDTYPDLFAAVGVHSGLAAGAANDLPSALAAMKGGSSSNLKRGAVNGLTNAQSRRPTIVFHGDGDTVVHPRNGQQVVSASAGTARSAEDAVARVAGQRAVTRHVYRDTAGAVAAEHWLVHGSPHAWSGGSSSGSYTDGQGPDATAEMVRFFLERSNPG